MPFDPKNQAERYVYSAPPQLPGSEKLYLERELRRLSIVTEKLAAAVDEMQEFLKTLP